MTVANTLDWKRFIKSDFAFNLSMVMEDVCKILKYCSTQYWVLNVVEMFYYFLTLRGMDYLGTIGYIFNVILLKSRSKNNTKSSKVKVIPVETTPFEHSTKTCSKQKFRWYGWKCLLIQELIQSFGCYYFVVIRLNIVAYQTKTEVWRLL